MFSYIQSTEMWGSLVTSEKWTTINNNNKINCVQFIYVLNINTDISKTLKTTYNKRNIYCIKMNKSKYTIQYLFY